MDLRRTVPYWRHAPLDAFGIRRLQNTLPHCEMFFLKLQNSVKEPCVQRDLVTATRHAESPIFGARADFGKKSVWVAGARAHGAVGKTILGAPHSSLVILPRPPGKLATNVSCLHRWSPLGMSPGPIRLLLLCVVGVILGCGQGGSKQAVSTAYADKAPKSTDSRSAKRRQIAPSSSNLPEIVPAPRIDSAREIEQEIPSNRSSERRTLADLLDGHDTSLRPFVPRHDRLAALPEFDADRLRSLGIRRLEGTYITLYTDKSTGDEVDRLPEYFDQAVPLWAEYFRVPASRLADWRVVGYCASRKQRFQAAGLFPDDLPPFLHGYQRKREFWFYDQPSDYYRRHLMLHEGVHAFMRAMLGGLGPPWYAEGIAELLATHRIVDGKIQVAWFPTDRESVPYWGRIKIVRDEYAARRGMMLSEIMRLDASAFRESPAYGWSWAAAAFLNDHPRYRDAFALLKERTRLPEVDFNSLLEAQLRDTQRELDEEWQIFVASIEYGYDLTRSAVEYSAARPVPDSGVTVEIDAARGWQSSGAHLNAGRAYAIRATGRYKIGDRPKDWWCEPNGVTIRYYRGQPIGRLMGAVRLDQGKLGAARLVVPLPIGQAQTLTPQQDGTLYLRINESPAELADNHGSLRIEITPDADRSVPD